MNVKLTVIQGRPQGKSLLFPCGEFVFGRGPECHIRPNSDWVSRQHCLLRVSDGAVLIRDLASRNGTLINGSRLVGERHLVHGDQLQVGPLVFEVQFDACESEGQEDVDTQLAAFGQDSVPIVGPDTSTKDHETCQKLVRETVTNQLDTMQIHALANQASSDG